MCNGQCGNAGLASLKEGEPIAAGYSFTLDPLESAITSTAQAAIDSKGLAHVILCDHLNRLCEIQRKALGEPKDEQKDGFESLILGVYGLKKCGA